MSFRILPPLKFAPHMSFFLFKLLLFFLLLSHWVFAHHLERIDLSASVSNWWQVAGPFNPLPSAIIVLIEFLHPHTLRHFLPIIVGWWLAYEAAVSTVQVLYDLPGRAAARSFLSKLLLSPTPQRAPVVLDTPIPEADRENSVLLRVGGPGLVAVKNGNVTVTELNGRFSRVLGPGLHNLGRLEYVRAALDLRQQERATEDVAVMTREGIGVQAAVTVTFRLSTGGETPTRARPYPYDEQAVRMAAYAETVGDDAKISTWDQAPLGRARGILAGIIANYQLDEILYPGAGSSEPYQAIRQELVRKLRASLADIGIELIDVQIGRLELPESAFQQYVDYWKAHLDSQIRLSLADGSASAIEEIEIARAEAEVTMIQAIIEGIRRARYRDSPAEMREIIALRLVEALEKIARQSQESQPLPQGLLPHLSDLRSELLPDVDRSIT